MGTTVLTMPRTPEQPLVERLLQPPPPPPHAVSAPAVVLKAAAAATAGQPGSSWHR